MAALTRQQLKLQSGGNEVNWQAAAAGGDEFANTEGSAYLFVKNASGSSRTLTISAEQTVSGAGLTVPDMTVTIDDSTEKVIGPFPTATFNDADGNVNISIDTETSVSYDVMYV